MAVRPEWLTDSYPELRERPPWVMQEMIELEPDLVEQIVATADTAALALLARGAGPHLTVGCGTSEHAAMGLAEMFSEAGIPTASRESFEAALDPASEGAVIAVSHSGDTWATNEALRAARGAGAATGLITAVADAEATKHSDALVVTPQEDKSWCHTVGYLSPLAAGVALAAAATGNRADAGAAKQLVADGVARRDAATGVAAALAGCDRLILIGSGADRVAARELTLKIEEACHLPCSYRDLETFLHGHLPACDETTGLVLIMSDRRGAGARAQRAEQLLRASRRVGVHTTAIAVDPPADDLLDAEAIPVATSDGLPAAAASLLGTAPAVQWIAHELAIARGKNPDLIRREQAPYREAAQLHRD
jgi:glutamine---fructose-6-phosphate transaminase (isomerizing)